MPRRSSQNSVIGAGSIVIKDIPANSVAVGNPLGPQFLRQPTVCVLKLSITFSLMGSAESLPATSLPDRKSTSSI